MKVLGIVVEYNPFHNGHIYHIEKSKEITGCDAVVCIMSGNFIQRGEPAIINKFARAEIALNCGADLIIELPHPYAMSSAESFAFGAVKILDNIGIVDSISFGSEHGNIDELNLIAEILSEEPDVYKSELKKQLELGLAYPVCRQKALKKYLLDTNMIHNISNSAISDFSKILETSNNILGIEYLKALKKINSSIKPYTICRVSNSYNSTELTGSISSATAIRKSIIGKIGSTVCPTGATADMTFETNFAASFGISDGKIQETAESLSTAPNDVIKYELSESTAHTLPPASKAILEREFSQGRGPVTINNYQETILSFIRQMKPEQLRELPDVSEGLEYRIKTAAEKSGTFEDLLENICTKRYTQTRIQRILFSFLTGLTKSDTEVFMKHGGPQYARILGFNKTGRLLLSDMKKKSSIPIITKTSDYKYSCNKLLARMLNIEAQATDMYVLGYKNPAYRKAGQDFTHNFVIFK